MKAKLIIASLLFGLLLVVVGGHYVDSPRSSHSIVKTMEPVYLADAQMIEIPENPIEYYQAEDETVNGYLPATEPKANGPPVA